MKITPIDQIRRMPRRNEKPAAETPEAGSGRALATQRDAAMMRAAEIGDPGIGATAPFLVQRLAQLWATPPLTDPALASAAYAKAEAGGANDTRRTLALVA